MSKVPPNLYILPRIIPPEDDDFVCPTSPETSIRIERGTQKLPHWRKPDEQQPSEDCECNKSGQRPSDSTHEISEQIIPEYNPKKKIFEQKNLQPKNFKEHSSPMSSSPQPFSTFTERTGTTMSLDTEIDHAKTSYNSKESFNVDYEQIHKLAFPPKPETETPKARITSSDSDINVYERVMESLFMKPKYIAKKNLSDSNCDRKSKPFVSPLEHICSQQNVQCECAAHKGLQEEDNSKNVLECKISHRKTFARKLSSSDDMVCSVYEVYNHSHSTLKTSRKESLQRTGSTNVKKEKLQREKGNLQCDVTVVVEGRCFYSFKNVLMSNSTWFKKCLEASPRKSINIIELPKISAEIFDLVHKWMFSKDFRLVTCENVISITQITFQLRIPELLEFCLNFCNRNKIKLPKRIFSTIPFPNEDKCDPTTKKNDNSNCQLILDPRLFQQIIRCPEFFSLPANTIINLLSEDDLNVESEVEVFDAAVAWLSCDWAHRVIHAPKLLHCIRFGCLTNHELISIVYHNKNLAILALPLCRDLILQSYLYWSACKSSLLHQLNVDLPSVKPRKAMKRKKKYILGNWEAAITIQAVWRGYRVRKCLSIRDGAAAIIQAAYRSYLIRTWVKECLKPKIEIEKKEKAEKSCRIKAAVVIQRAFRKYQKNKCFFKTAKLLTKKCGEDNETTLLLIGGYDMSKCFDKSGQRCYLYKLDKKRWELISVIPESIYYGKAAIINNEVYVTGGSNLEHNSRNINSFKTSWKWNLTTNKWTRIANMNWSRTHHALVAVVDRVFAIGGSDQNQTILNTVEMYEPDTDEWYEMSPMLINRMGHSAVYYNNLIIVCGGIGLIDKPYGEILSSVEIYSPNSDKWCRGIDLRIPRCFASLTEYNSNLYIVGGISFATPIKGSVSKIDKCTDCKSEWCPCIETNFPIHAAATGIIGSYLCVVGGLCSQIGGPISYGNCYNVETSKRMDEFNVSLPVKLTGMCWVQIPASLAVCINKTI